MSDKSVADIEGPWSNPNFQSGLIERCREHWNTPICKLPDVAVAMFLGQRFALAEMIAEAQQRLERNELDDTEWYEGHLKQSLEGALKRG